MADLQASGNEAQLVIRDYHLLVKQAIIRPIQLARGMVAAYPCVLNTLAIGAVLGANLALSALRLPCSTLLKLPAAVPLARLPELSSAASRRTFHDRAQHDWGRVQYS